MYTREKFKRGQKEGQKVVRQLCIACANLDFSPRKQVKVATGMTTLLRTVYEPICIARLTMSIINPAMLES